MKIILFGGSFDPIHNAHLLIAKSALKAIGGHRVIFILNNKSKNKTCDADVKHRLAMLQLAIKNNKQFIASDIELKNRNKISYTYDTVVKLKKKYKDAEIYFLMGSDQYNSLNQWYKYQQLLSIVKIIVYERLGYEIKNNKYQPIVLNNKPIDISSSNIKNKNEWDNVPMIVNDYINDNALYYNYRYMLFNITDKRKLHSLRVAKMAFNITKKFKKEWANFAFSAGVYHDVCKCESQIWLEEIAYHKYRLKKAISWKVLHGPVASLYLKETLKFNNKLILDAIARHTLPLDECKISDLTLLDKVLFCCDKLEPCRTNKDIENINYYRKLLNKDVDLCFNELLKALQQQYGN